MCPASRAGVTAVTGGRDIRLKNVIVLGGELGLQDIEPIGPAIRD
jgi:hypothetical protein